MIPAGLLLAAIGCAMLASIAAQRNALKLGAVCICAALLFFVAAVTVIGGQL